MATYRIFEGTTCTRIDVHERVDGWLTVRTVYVHRAEYRHWDA